MSPLSLLGLSAALASPPPIQTGPLPHEPITDGSFKVHGLAEGGFRAGLQGSAGARELELGATLQFARLQTVYSHPDGFGTVLQIEAANGSVQLLDATAIVGDKAHTQLVVGRFKTPLSSEYLIPAGRLLLPNRALTVNLSTRRLTGAQLSHNLHQHVLVRVGVYNPSGSAPVQGVGTTSIAAVDLHPGGFTLHAGAAVWLHDDKAPELLGDSVPVGDRSGDLAATWHEHGWTLHVEGLGSRRVDGSGWNGAATALMAHRFELHPDLEIEPVLSWDSLQEQDELVHRGSAGVNLHLDNWHMVQTLAYEAELGPQRRSTYFLQTQVGF